MIYNDPVYTEFLRGALEDADFINKASDVLTVKPQAGSVGPVNRYVGWLRDAEHLLRNADGTVRVSSEPIPFMVDFPPDYCRSTDPQLQFRIVRIAVPLVHPNCKGGLLCLGPHFRPATRLRSLVQLVYAIASSRNYATDHAFDPEACRYYLSHPDQVHALRSRPLWRQAVAGSTRVRRIEKGGRGTRSAEEHKC